MSDELKSGDIVIFTKEKQNEGPFEIHVAGRFLESKGVCEFCHKEIVIRLGEAWHSKSDKVWHETCSYQEAIEKQAAEIARLKEALGLANFAGTLTKDPPGARHFSQGDPW